MTAAANIQWVAADPASRAVLELAAKLAEPSTTLLITGESGTGKDQLARWIHQHGPRRDAPFLKIDCASLPSELVESELFGHERGAFTGRRGAQARPPGNGAGRHDRPRRSRRAHPRHAGQTSARARRAHFRAPGRHGNPAHGSAADGAHQYRSHESRRRRPVSRRSFLPPERARHRGPAAARTPRRYCLHSRRISSRASAPCMAVPMPRSIRRRCICWNPTRGREMCAS